MALIIVHTVSRKVSAAIFSLGSFITLIAGSTLHKLQTDSQAIMIIYLQQRLMELTVLESNNCTIMSK